MAQLLVMLALSIPAALSAQSFDLGKSCRYQLEPNPSLKPDQILFRPADSWKPIKSSVIALGSNSETLWLECNNQLETSGKPMVLVSQYNFSRRIEAYQIPNGKPLEALPKSFWQRQDAFRLQASPAVRILIRYDADLVKTAYFQIMPESELWTQGKHEASFFFADAGIVALFVAFNLMLAVSFRSSIPVLYALTTLSYFFYQIIQFGFGPILFYPQNPNFNGKMISLSAGVAILFYQGFFQKLLQLREIAPRVNQAMVAIHVLSSIYVVVTVLGLAPIGFLQKLGRLLFFTASGLVFLGGWIVYRKNFRPAIYSIYGFMIMTLCQSVYFLVMAGFIDAGAYYVKALLPAGQFLEYLLFFTTLSLRLRDRGQINRLRDIARNETVQREISQNAKLRLSDEKAGRAEAELQSLFSTEKIFCDEDLSLDRLADMISITRHELSDLLSKRFNTNFYEFVNRYRIEEAKRLLVAESQRNVLDIALAVGFNSKSTFNKEFKRVTKQTPKEVRAAAKS